MMIEQNTNYAYKLKYMANPTFDKVRDLSTRFYRELPQALQDELFGTLNRGPIIFGEPQMTAYLYAFGQMHQAKLNFAYGKLPREFFELSEINIIDYGCGQALGTMCYADFLRENGYAQNVETITLIEPSEICLKRAALHASAFFPNAEIKPVNKMFDDLSQDDIVCCEETPTLHIFSNVLDMTCFDLSKFSGLIKGCLNGFNQFVCVGPYFNHSAIAGRMNVFCSLLDGNANYNETFDKYEFEEGKAWTAHFCCFSVGEMEEMLSTEVTDEDIENGIKDEFGVVYSRDGKRLLTYINDELEEYKVKDGTKIICDFAFADRDDYAPSLKKIFLPDTVTHIGKFAFSCFTSQSLNIPQNVTFIDGGFIQADSVNREKPTLICDSSRFNVYGDALYTQEGEILHPYFGNSSTIIVHEGVKSIGAYAFYSCHSVRSILLPNSLLNIGEGAFQYCTSLESVNIPSKIKKIGDDLFYYCRSLQQIIIPKDSVEKIKQLLPTELWDKLYYLEKADVNAENMDDDLPF